MYKKQEHHIIFTVNLKCIIILHNEQYQYHDKHKLYDDRILLIEDTKKYEFKCFGSVVNMMQTVTWARNRVENAAYYEMLMYIVIVILALNYLNNI